MVYVYANGTAIYSEQVLNLPSQDLENITFKFTASLAYGNYSISACDQLVKWVKVTIPGDVGGFGVVGPKDFHILAMYWLESVPPAPANVDIGGYGIIGPQDFHILAQHWLQ